MRSRAPNAADTGRFVRPIRARLPAKLFEEKENGDNDVDVEEEVADLVWSHGLPPPLIDLALGKTSIFDDLKLRAVRKPMHELHDAQAEDNRGLRR